MKRRILSIALALGLVSLSGYGQDKIPERLLLTSGHYVAAGARPMGMAGTYTGIADDYASVWWNPAGLAQVKRIEVQGSLARTGYANETAYFGGSDDATTGSLRLNNLGIVFPVPVYQGAMSFAFGYNQVLAFDRGTKVQAPPASVAPWSSFNELESGRLGLWSLAGAVDVSPNLALGLGVNYFTGVDEYTLTGRYLRGSETVYSESAINTDLSAWGANFGALFRAGRFARIGLMFQTPMRVSLNEDWEEDGDTGFFDYAMTYPAVIRLGASVAPGRWMLAADVEYRDWTSMEFRTETPYSGVSRTEANQQIKDTYQATTRFSVGGEYLFPAYGLRLRGGYGLEPSAYTEGGNKDTRHLLSAGLGVLVDRSVMLDAAFQTASFTEKVTPGLVEDVSLNNVLFTISYRM